jgi:hypothetical protein
MAVKKLTAYSLFCDACGGRYEGNDYTIWESEGDMVESAEESDWTTDNTLWHCPSCPYLSLCACCGQLGGEDASERDGYCQPCWDSAKANDVNDLCTIEHSGAEA